MPRLPDDVVWCTTLRPDEHAVAQEMASKVLITSKSDLLRLALTHYAKHLRVPLGPRTFQLLPAGEHREHRRQRWNGPDDS
jgi:hypothetical protein